MNKDKFIQINSILSPLCPTYSTFTFTNRKGNTNSSGQNYTSQFDDTYLIYNIYCDCNTSKGQT